MEEEEPLYNLDETNGTLYAIDETEQVTLENNQGAKDTNSGNRYDASEEEYDRSEGAYYSKNYETKGAGIGYGEEDMLYAYGRQDENALVADADDQISTGAYKRRVKNPVGLLFKVMFGPVEGWKALKRSRMSPDRMGLCLFFPLCVLVSLSSLCSLVYEADDTLGETLIIALISFMSLVFSYFILPVVGKPFFCARLNDVMDTDFGKNMVMLSLSTLALFRIFFNLVPWLQPVIVFMPLWTIYAIYRGVVVMKVPTEKQAMSTALLSILVICLPIGFDWILSMIF